jgi:hypothetical protein
MAYLNIYRPQAERLLVLRPIKTVSFAITIAYANYGAYNISARHRLCLHKSIKFEVS